MPVTLNSISMRELYHTPSNMEVTTTFRYLPGNLQFDQNRESVRFSNAVMANEALANGHLEMLALEQNRARRVRMQSLLAQATHAQQMARSIGSGYYKPSVSPHPWAPILSIGEEHNISLQSMFTNIAPASGPDDQSA